MSMCVCVCVCVLCMCFVFQYNISISAPASSQEVLLSGHIFHCLAPTKCNNKLVSSTFSVRLFLDMSVGSEGGGRW